MAVMLLRYTKRCLTQISVLLASGLLVAGCANHPLAKRSEPQTQLPAKPVIYQTLPRLFGNTRTANIPWGTIAQNGVGKFSDFTPRALAAIKGMGANYIWFTGVLHHAMVHDYTAYGISNDDPDVVKGRAGSPYAIKDYYNVDPDLADDVSKRLQEYEALIKRTHAAGLKVIMDIVPNHVARRYQSITNPPGQRDLGADDDTSVVYRKNNDFYYVPGQAFQVPDFKAGEKPLGGQPNPLVDGKFAENPAKWTGNGARSAKPSASDWYETVKINYGVRPDGSHDFPTLPADYAHKSVAQHAAFWARVDVPDSWKKMRAIAMYWLDKGVDGFRYDVAGMVPVEFWSYLNSAIKLKKPDSLLIAELYNPKVYRDYIGLGKMDYLYDKVGTYDTLRAIVEGKANTDLLPPLRHSLQDIDTHLLHFLENHDEQRIASSAFAGYGAKAEPAMVYTALADRGAVLLYFGQAEGEAATQDLGYGKATRTTIFDYAGVPAHQAWMDGGKFDGAKLTDSQHKLHQFYQRLLNLASKQPAFKGYYAGLHQYNRAHSPGYDNSLFSFARWQGKQHVIVVSNFSEQAKKFELIVPASLIQRWQLADGDYPLTGLLQGRAAGQLEVRKGIGHISLTLNGLASKVLNISGA